MSTLLYQSLTNAREVVGTNVPITVSAGTAGNAPPSKPLPKLVDAVAALVPVEVLAAHAFLFGSVSKSSDPADAKPVLVTITNEAWATRFWVLLLIAAVAFYAIPHVANHGWDRWDWLRALIPAGAFAAWTILQKATLFDAVADLGNVERAGLGVGLAILALLSSTTLASEAQKKTPSPNQTNPF